MIKKIKTACNRDCPDACGMIATVDNGQIVRLQGDPDHPVTKGFLCKRTSRFLQRQYDPQRITTALIRRNKKSVDSEWESVSIEDALDLVADKLMRYRSESGPASIMNYRCGGSMGMMKYVTDYFFQLFGPVTIKSGDVCAGAGDWAQEMDFGAQDSNDFFDLLNAKTIFLWGKNIYVSQVHLLPLLKRAKERGAKLVLIDPIKHRTASLCDRYVQVAPGADAALAFGMSRWLYENNLFDSAAETWCDNFGQFIQLIQSRDVADWADMAGIELQTLIELARTYGDGPSTILVGWGMQRRRNGAAIIRSIDALGAVTGNIGIPGAGVSFYFPRKGAFDLSFLNKKTAPRAIPEPLLGPGIEGATDPPINMVFVSAANPVTNVPESNTIARALTDRFTVVVDMFMTDTARCADVILPAATMLEDDDIIGAYGHHYLNKLRPVVSPPDDALTDYEIIRRLSRRVGLEKHFERNAQEWQREMVRALASQGITLEKMNEQTCRNPEADQVVFRDRKFKTANQRCNLLTSYNHPVDNSSDNFPLELMAVSTDEAQASQWQGDQQIGPSELKLHTESANGFSDGDLVEISTEKGKLRVRLKLDDSVHRKIAVMDKGGWLAQGRCANAIIAAECSDFGECAVYYETPVHLTRLTEDPAAAPAVKEKVSNR